MVVFKMFDNVGVHLPELAAVALVKYKNNMLVINRMALVFCNEYIQLLNRRYNNAGSGILKLFLQNGPQLQRDTLHSSPLQKVKYSCCFFQTLLLRCVSLHSMAAEDRYYRE